MISKFGVGAKNAGFYLGDKISVITKEAGDPMVREFSLDKHEFSEKRRNQQMVYSGKILSRLVGQDCNSPLVQNLCKEGVHPALLDRLDMIEKTKEFAQDHFCVILVRLKVEKIPTLTDRECEHITSDLANIYHFYLHPEQLPNPLVSSINKKFKLFNGKGMSAIPSNFKTSVDTVRGCSQNP